MLGVLNRMLHVLKWMLLVLNTMFRRLKMDEKGCSNYEMANIHVKYIGHNIAYFKSPIITKIKYLITHHVPVIRT